MRVTRLHRVLAGEDGPGKRALPAGEFLNLLPLLAVCVLVVNDHWLKAGDLVPAVLTGKLSDVAGLLFFPLLLTSLTNVVTLGASVVFGTRWNFSLSRAKLLAATAATGCLFAAIKLSPAAAGEVARLLGEIGFHSTIVADPTDLLALPMLGVAYWLGIREIQRVPLGRLQVIERRWHVSKTPAIDGLADVTDCGASPTDVAELASTLEHYFVTGESADATVALTRLRST